MLDQIRNALVDLSSAIQAGKIYSTEHPRFRDFIARAYKSLKEVLNEKKELVVGIVDQELAWEEEIFFSLSQKLRTLIQYLESKGIERIIFIQGLEEEELGRFVSFLVKKAKDAEDPQGYLSSIGVRNIRTGKIRAPTGAPAPPEPAPEGQKQRSIQGLASAVEKVLNEEDVDYIELKFNVLNYMEDFMGRREELVDLVSIKEKDLNTFLHLLNVSILTMHIASKLGYSQDDVLDLGIAGLFHDIGKLAVSRRILQKKSALKEDEFFKMKHHTIQGAEILVKYADTVGPLPAVVAFEHHLRYDMKGYPRVPYPQRPHTASLIVSLCDVYDALAQRRSYKKDFPPLKIYNIMMGGKGASFHPQLVEDFFRIIGVWPVGTVVALRDGRIAVVRTTNPKDVFRPVVEVIEPEDQREILDLSDASLGVSIDHALNPYKEGKKYLDRIQKPS